MTKAATITAIFGCILAIGCESKTAPEPPTSNNAPIAMKPDAKHDPERAKEQFRQMEQSMHAVAGIKAPGSTPETDFSFVMPSDDWEKSSHAGGTKKESVWLFTSKKTGIKTLVSAAGTQENPQFVVSAQQVYDASFKKRPEVTREWKVGNFTLRRSFTGFIDDRHGETTITAFSPACTLEFNIASESLDRDELFKVADSMATEFIEKNPKGGFPAK